MDTARIGTVAELTEGRFWFPQHLRGKGLAGQLMEASLEYARKNDLNVRAFCDYAKAWLRL